MLQPNLYYTSLQEGVTEAETETHSDEQLT